MCIGRLYTHRRMYMWVSLVTCLKCESCDLAQTLDPIVRHRWPVISDTHCSLATINIGCFFFSVGLRLASRWISVQFVNVLVNHALLLSYAIISLYGRRTRAHRLPWLRSHADTLAGALTARRSFYSTVTHDQFYCNLRSKLTTIADQIVLITK